MRIKDWEFTTRVLAEKNFRKKEIKSISVETIVEKLVQMKTKKGVNSFLNLKQAFRNTVYVLQCKMITNISQFSLNLWNQNVINKKEKFLIYEE